MSTGAESGAAAPSAPSDPENPEKREASEAQEAGETDHAHGKQTALYGVLAHDLRNKISSILMNATYLLKEANNEAIGPRYRLPLEQIKNAAARVNQTVAELLDLSHILAGDLVLARGVLLLDPLLDEALRTAAPLAARKSLQLRSELPRTSSPVRADRARLLQVLDIVLRETIDVASDGDTVTLKVTSDRAELRFCVEDQGVALSDALRAELFGPDARPAGVHLETRLPIQLATALMTLHGGRLWTEPMGDLGVKVCFTLPLGGG